MKKLLIAAFIVLLASTGRSFAQVSTLTDGLTAKQAAIYIVKDAKVKNLTAFELLKTTNVPAWKSWNVLYEGISLDAGVSYDAANKIDGGALMLGKNINQLLTAIPVSFPLKDKLDLTLYLAGDSVSKDGDKLVNKFAFGGAYISGTIKFGPQGK